MAMLDRVVVNVIDVPLEIVVVANKMLPKTPLPDASFSLVFAAGGYSLTVGDRA